MVPNWCRITAAMGFSPTFGRDAKYCGFANRPVLHNDFFDIFGEDIDAARK
jgi:hypothetical protein